MCILFFMILDFFALYWTPSLSILLDPKEYMYISYGYCEFVKFITKTIIFLTSYLIFSFIFFNELLGQFKNLEYLGNRPGSSLIKSNLLLMIEDRYQWRRIDLLDLELKSSQATIARSKGTNVCARLLVPMSILSKEKKSSFWLQRLPFRSFSGLTWWMIVLNSVGKPIPSPRAKLRFLFIFF